MRFKKKTGAKMFPRRGGNVIFSYLDLPKFRKLNHPDFLAQLHEEYQKNQPFPHIVIDNLFHESELDLALQAFPSLSAKKWWKYDNALEKKLAFNKMIELNSWLKELIHELMDCHFVEFIQKITGIEGLIVDHTLNGGGVHNIIRGGKLDIHADYNYHPITNLDRRVNVLLYLNKYWKTEWGGNLEFWNQDMSQCVKSIEPFYNRLVIFSTTDSAFHGHPEPLMCPEWESRKSIAIYYYTNGRPEKEKSEPHSTLFKRRPQDPIIQEYEELRKNRAVRRIKDQTS